MHRTLANRMGHNSIAKVFINVVPALAAAGIAIDAKDIAAIRAGLS
jgi:hypothetical protein